MAVVTSTGSFPFLQVRPSAKLSRAGRGRSALSFVVSALLKSDFGSVVKVSSSRPLSFSSRGTVPPGPFSAPAKGKARKGKKSGTTIGVGKEADDVPVDVVGQRRRAARRVDPFADGRGFNRESAALSGNGQDGALPPGSPFSVNNDDNGEGESGFQRATGAREGDSQGLDPEQWFEKPASRADIFLDSPVSVPLDDDPKMQITLTRRQWRRPFSEILLHH